MRQGRHIHTAGDGRGPRDVFLNGKLIDRVMYADTSAGFVRVVGNPVKLDKWKKRVLTRTLRGVVEVRAKVGAGDTAVQAELLPANAKAVGLADALSGQSHTSDGLCPGGTEGSEQ